MKSTNLKICLVFVLLIYISLNLIPFIHFINYEEKNKDTSENSFYQSAENKNLDKENSVRDAFVLYDADTEKIWSINDQEFMIMSLAEEMNFDLPTEALKAQCVAAYSYYSYLRNKNIENNFHISFNSLDNSIFMSMEEMREDWGEQFDENYKKYSDIVDMVWGEKVFYNGEIACSTFFSESNGNTESSKDIWGKEIPYLISVASPYDNLSKSNNKLVAYTPAQVKEILETNWSYGKFDYTIPYSKWFSDIKYTYGLSVMSIDICTFKITGEEARTAFKLPSLSFRVEYDGQNFNFMTKGQGSFVGMSKTGAVYMAMEGADYREIINWYYPGTEIIGK